MLKILVIEDDVIDQLALSRLIKKNKLDCKLTILDKIEDAKSHLEKNNYDLVICDLNLPDGKAFDLKQYINKQPFILLSGYLEQPIIDEALKYGAIQVLQKSSELFQLRSILNLIEEMLDKKKEKIQPIELLKKDKTSSFNIQNLLSTFDNQKEPVAEILEAILIETPKMVEDIYAAIKSEDRDSIKKIAHRLKSNYIMIGLHEQHKIVEQMEKESADADFNFLEQKLFYLKEMLASTYPKLQASLANLQQK